MINDEGFILFRLFLRSSMLINRFSSGRMDYGTNMNTKKKQQHKLKEMFAHFRVRCLDIEGEHKESEQNHNI